jgi:LAGLIDADG endonuclease
MFSIELHIKDYFLLKKIQTFFGVGNIITRNKKLSVIYSVQSIKDINSIIIPHFTKYPLLTQKDFQFFCLALNLINKKEHLYFEGIKKLVNIRASMNRGLTNKLKEAFPNTIPLKVSFNNNEKIKDPY